MALLADTEQIQPIALNPALYPAPSTATVIADWEEMDSLLKAIKRGLSAMGRHQFTGPPGTHDLDKVTVSLPSLPHSKLATDLAVVVGERE